MELIPIIYTVLEIVVVLTILTLSISSISYRMKQRRSEKVINNNDNSNLLEPSLKVEPPLKLVKKTIEVRSVQKPMEAIKEKSVREKKSYEHRESPLQKSSSKHKTDSNDEKPRIQNGRISVLKNLSSSPAQDKIPNESKGKTDRDQIRTLGEDILDKYAEENDNEMFTLKVQKQKANPQDR